MQNKDEFKYFNCHVLTAVGDYFLSGASSFMETRMKKRLLVHMVMRRWIWYKLAVHNPSQERCYVLL